MARNGKGLPSSVQQAAVDAFLKKVAAAPVAPHEGRGRLLFALDATASREPTWRQACRIQAEMFREAAALGGLDIQLAFYRGFAEFRASPWTSHGDALLRWMADVHCVGGQTQLRKVLDHALAETRVRKLNAVVFVGDCMEEDVDRLSAKSGELGLLGVPLFIFHEGDDPVAAQAFAGFARLSGGACCRFDASSSDQLRDLLRAVAVYAAGGRPALKDFSARRGGIALRLIEQVRS